MLTGTELSIPDEICSGIAVENSRAGNVWKGSFFFSSVISRKCFAPGLFIDDIRYWVEPLGHGFFLSLGRLERPRQKTRNKERAILLMDFSRHGGLSSDEVEGGARGLNRMPHSHRVDEPTGLFLGTVTSQQSRLPLQPARSVYCSYCFQSKLRHIVVVSRLKASIEVTYASKQGLWRRVK